MKKDKCSLLKVKCVLFAGFCLFYAIHGVLREREFELYAYIGGIIVIFVYIVIDLAVNDHRTLLKWVSKIIYSFFG